MRKLPEPPSELVPRGRGRQFWREIVGVYDLREDEMQLLREACRMLDQADQLHAAADTPIVATGKGPQVHPALVELRQVRQELRRTLAGLALPEDAGDGLAKSRAGRRAAQARWAARG